MIKYDYRDTLLNTNCTKNIIGTDGTVEVTGHSYRVLGSTVIITNDEIETESFYMTQSLCSGGVLLYGSCESAEAGFTMHENVASLKDKVLNFYMYLNGDPATMIQLGVFRVESDQLTSDRTKREVKMYDDLYRILNADATAWYKALVFPMTLEAFRNSFLDYFHVEAEETVLVNDSMIVTKTVDAAQISGADIIRSICEVNGCFGTITNTGKFRFLVLSKDIDSGLFPMEILFPSDDLLPSDPNPETADIPKAHYRTIQFQDYMCEGITKLVVRNSDDDGGVIVGEEGNTYIITGNFLLFGKSSVQMQAIANNIFKNISNRYYKPMVAECTGDFCHELGDPVRVRTIYRGIVSYILKRDLRGIQSLTDTYTAEGTERYTGEMNSVQTQIKQLAGKTASLKVGIDTIEGRVEDIEDGSASIITQLSNQISAKVSSNGGDTSFGWELNNNNFKLISSSDEVFVCDKGGVSVTGSVSSSGSSGTTTISNGMLYAAEDGSSCLISGTTAEFNSGTKRIVIQSSAGSINFWANSTTLAQTLLLDSANKLSIGGSRIVTAGTLVIMQLLRPISALMHFRMA